MQAGSGLQCLQLKNVLLGRGGFPGFEVPADAEAVQSAVDPPRRDAIPVFKPDDGECSVVAHA
jgi:hypothetical protein